jgi:aerobic-type carbon monoxide dehydrogenase small subunit (CoxS/CutS family)
MSTSISLVVNEHDEVLEIPAATRLCDLLRDGLCLTGTHVGCSEGVCGSCTVLVDGRSVRSCLVLAGQCAGARIETVEAFTAGDALGPAQAALVEHNAIQCGFCTPGFVVMLEELRRRPEAAAWSAEELKGHLSAVACRCTGYRPVLAAALGLLRGSRGA